MIKKHIFDAASKDSFNMLDKASSKNELYNKKTTYFMGKAVVEGTGQQQNPLTFLGAAF